MPNSQSWDFGDGVDGAFFRCIFVHGIRTDIGHFLCVDYCLLLFSVIPAVAFDQSYTIGGSFPQPVLPDKCLIAADLVRILRDLAHEQFFIQHCAIGSVHIPPAIICRILRPSDQIQIVFDSFVCPVRSVYCRAANIAHNLPKFFGGQFCAESGIDSSDELFVCLFCCKTPDQFGNKVRFFCIVFQRQDI